MDPIRPQLRPQLSPRADVRLHGALLARLQTIQLLRMNESQVADLVRQIESDPLFLRLLYPSDRRWKVVSFKPHPRTRLSSGFYEVTEQTVPVGASPEVASLFQEHDHALACVRRMGAELFEAHFLRAEEVLSVGEVARACGIDEADVSRVRDFLLAYSVRAEFFDPSKLSTLASSRAEDVTSPVVRLARLSVQSDGDVAFEFGSPLLARGRYDIQYDRLQTLLRADGMALREKRHLRAFVRRLELVNWRQNTLYRILDFLALAQRAFFATRDSLKRTTLTQRQLARKLSVAPSTINRAIHGRSLVLPWGEEKLLEDLFCSRKTLCLDALEALDEEDPEFQNKTDLQIQLSLRDKLGLEIPRRTVNIYRSAAHSADDGRASHS